MKTLHIVYWSGTGNTAAMAEALAKGASQAGAEVLLQPVDQAKPETVAMADAMALGCPSMGAEVLEEGDMEPFVAALTARGLDGKPLALFGSYDWGDGQWMREWQERMVQAGARLVADGLIAQLAPDDQVLAACAALGAQLAQA